MKLFLVFISKLINNLFASTKGTIKYYSVWKYLNVISTQGMGRMQGVNVEESGETNVIEMLDKIKKSKLVVFDVGANKGQYLASIIKGIKKSPAEIHVFEPFPSNIKTLEKRFVNNDRFTFHINCCALGESSGTIDFFTDNDGSDIASIYDLKVSARPFNKSMQTKAELKTLDEYFDKKDVACIDLLKIDVEGAEYNVLLGAQETLEKGLIQNIQFEFGTANITSRVFFYDFWELLANKYDFFQVLKDGLMPITQYSTSQEIFVTTNYFLTLKQRANK